MKTLVVYYSLNGNCDFVGQEIAKRLNADTLRLVVKNDIKTTGFGRYLQGGKTALHKEEAELEPYTVNMDDYDSVIIGAPVWAATMPPALNTFVKDHKFIGKNLYIYACSLTGNGNKMMNHIKENLPGNNFVGALNFKEPLKHKEEALKQIESFCTGK